MTQDRKGAARDDADLDVGSFGLGLADLGDLDGDPSEMFGGAKAHQAAAPQARTPSAPARTHQPEPDDIPDFGDPSFGGPAEFGGAGDFDAGSSSAPAARNAPDPGDWSSLAGLGGSPTSRTPSFGGGQDDEGDPDTEFAEAQFGGARSVASLGRIPDEPEPRGRFRQDEPALDDVVTDFAGGDDDYVEQPKPSLYRADPTEEEDEDEGDRSLSLSDDEGSESEEDEDEDEDETGGLSIVDRLKRFAIPVAAAAAIGGVGLVGWPHVAPLIGMGGEEYPVQTAAPVVPKQPQQAATVPAFPPSAQPPQRPALPGGSSLLPAAPGQQAVAVQPGLPGQQQALPGSGIPPRQIGFPPVQQSVAGQLPQGGPAIGAQLPSAPAQAAYPALPTQGTGIQQVALPDRLPADPRAVVQTPPAATPNTLAGGFNARTAPVGDVEARLASIASDLSTIRIRQEDAARAAQTDRDEFGRRLGVLEKRVGEGGKVMTPKPVAEEVKPRKTERAEKAERVERVERPTRSARRAAYQQEASADDGVPPLKPKVVQGFSLKGVSRNIATVEGRSGVVEVGVGQTIPGVGEVKAIRRYGSDWVVVVGKGVIVQQ